MRRFGYRRADDPADAVAQVSGRTGAAYLGGGTNLVDHLKLGVASPDLLVDVNSLPLDAVDEIDGGLRIGAGVRNSDLAADPRVRRRFPVLSRALLAGASPQIRNRATTAGNLLQRTRCVYFQDVTTPCNKREPGTGCSAVDGYARYNAVLGASDACVAVHPSDMAVALAALDADVLVLGPDGERRVPMSDFHRLPGEHPERDTTLRHGELVTAVEVRDLPDGTASTYRKVRDRASYAFALVSVAAVARLEDGLLRDVRLAWGGVAHKPWRAHEAERRLEGATPSPAAVADAVDAELAAAAPGPQSAYKLPMLRNTTVLVLAGLTGVDPGDPA